MEDVRSKSDKLTQVCQNDPHRTSVNDYISLHALQTIFANILKIIILFTLQECCILKMCFFLGALIGQAVLDG